MTQLSDAWENKALDYLLRGETTGIGANLYIRGWQSGIDDTSDGDAANECDFTNYAAITVARNTSNWAAPGSRAIANAVDFAFPAAGSGSQNMRYICLCDAATSGEIIAYHDLGAGGQVAITSGKIVRIPAGDFDIDVATGGWTTFLANEWLDFLLRAEALLLPSDLHLGLWATANTLTDASDGDSTGELTGNNYARHAITRDTSHFDSANAGATANSLLEEFAAASGGDWSEFQHWMLCDAPSSGNGWMYGSLGAGVTILEDEAAAIPVGSLDLTLN